MSTSEPEAPGDTQVTGEEPTQQPGVGERLAALPLLGSACQAVGAVYTASRDSQAPLGTLCRAAEDGVQALATAAQPLLHRLEPQIASVSGLAHRGLDTLEGTLQRPPKQVLADTKELVTSRVMGAREAVASMVAGTKDSVASRVSGAVDATRDAVLGSHVGQLVQSGLDTVLGCSEAWMDNHLPLTDAELARLATSSEDSGADVMSVQQQRQEQSYFVRLGSLSERLRQQAWEHSLGKLRLGRQRAQEGLQQLAQALSLMESVKQGENQEGVPGPEESNTKPEVESRALAMFHQAAEQFRATCTSLGATLRGLPDQVSQQVEQVGCQVEALRNSFSGVHSARDLSAGVLVQSRERLAQARAALDAVLEYVAQQPPLMWLVGPFSPGVVETPGKEKQKETEEKEKQKEKQEEEEEEERPQLQ
ncbi:perilipin-3 [Erinaceus europaeus]|uniref:Perilipin n=1 Tax=Erinaceus europaeus TaxID=9365 RepID=A0A1S3WDJ7_ERIEU|nr:perilipin-3 [Erinaceus europaeus]